MTYIAVPKQRKPIDPEPVESLGGFRDEKQKKRHPRHSSARSVVSLPPKRSNGNAHHRRMSQNICSSRSVGPQSIVSEQWMLTKQCCPRCNMNMMRNGYNDSYHCHSCGTIVCASAQNPSIYVDELISIHKLPESNGEKDSNIVEKNPFVLAHQQMIASPRAMAMPHQLDSQVHPPFGFDESIYSFAQNHHNPTLHQGGLYQSLSLNACELPTPNHSRHELFNQPTPNKNRKQIKNHQYFYHPIDFKENSYGDSNLSKNEEMSAVDEAKLRMENAQNVMKKKILYYNSSSDYMF
jgi:ribosomal protein L37AE/L43A